MMDESGVMLTAPAEFTIGGEDTLLECLMLSVSSLLQPLLGCHHCRPELTSY